MEKILLVLFALFAVASIATARHGGNPLLLKGSVYCDTCRCGFETPASTRIPGAVVRVECRSRKTSDLTYMKESITDSEGEYRILVEDDRGDDVCDAVLVKSSDPECSVPSGGRDRARVILTSNNGMSSSLRFANAMGFDRDTPLAACAQVLEQYQEN